MDDSFDQTLKQLKDKVSKFASENHSSHSGVKKIKFNTKAILVYTTPIVLVTCVLFFTKPFFVTKEVEDSDGVVSLRINFRKLLISIIVLTAMIDGLIFLYLRKKQISL